MKKLMALALVAMLASAAQAITLTQTGSYANGSSGNWSTGTNQIVSRGPNTSHTVALVYNLSEAAATSTGTLFTYKTGSSDNNSITIGVENGNYTVAFSNFGAEVSGTTNTVAVDITENTILGISITRTGLSAASSTIIITVNGSVLFSTTTASIKQGYYGILDVGSDSLFDTDSAIAFASSSEAVTDITTAAADIATAVPEPTCLALLALGVAGLALRRRA